MMSWNSVVSGNNQYGGKSQQNNGNRDSVDLDAKQPLEISAKETKEVSQKVQKPSPIFGNQQKHGVKKPTAHVKPLKCTAPTDGFTTVHNSRQMHSGGSSTHTGSRVSELDDFTTDLPAGIVPNTVNITANVVSNFMEYPPVTSTAPTKNKKKKKKGKEQIGQISEVRILNLLIHITY